MPLHAQRGLALIGFGTLLAFVGLVWVANLFGVADEHAKRIATNRWNRWLAGVDQTADEVRTGIGFRLARYGVGGGWMLTGLLIVAWGVIYLIAQPAE